MTLYELTEAYTDLMNLDELDTETFDMALSAINESLDKKLANIGRLVRNLESDSMALKTEEERLNKKRKTIENSIARLKEYAKQALITTGKTKSSDGIITWGIQNNPPKVEIEQGAEIDHAWCNQVPESWVPDKTAIANALKSGSVIQGCKLIVEQGVRLK